MMNSINNIFTIQTDIKNENTLVQIETLITRGIYRFTLLGVSQKHSSDIKDRVYSALRSNGLLNLKSDNRKIIVNMSPDNTSKNEGIYDLAIAMSCISCIDKNIPNTSMIAVGGLSLSGKILKSEYLSQAIYAAHINHVPLVICSMDDLITIKPHIIEQLETCNIKIVGSEYLKDMIEILKKTSNTSNILPISNTYSKNNIALKKIYEEFIDFNTMNQTIMAIFIGLCGGHNTIIETSISKEIKQMCLKLSKYNPERHFGKDIYKSFKHKTKDNHIHTDVVYIENIKNHVLAPYLVGDTDSVIALYAPCICGYQHDRKCICSKRSIIQHKRYIESQYLDIFDIKITESTESIGFTEFDDNYIQKFHLAVSKIRRVQFERFINEKNLTEQQIFLFSDDRFLNKHREISNILLNLDKDAKDIWSSYHNNSNILRLAQTIQDILNITNKNAHLISKEALLLAISYIPKMDF